MLAELGQCPTRRNAPAVGGYQCLAQPELATEAELGVVKIASAIRDTQRAEAVSALQRVMAVPGGRVRSRAKQRRC